MSAFVASYRIIPTLLFRANDGSITRLRDYRSGKSYDVRTRGGLVHPSILNSQKYKAPNGASMQPVGDKQQQLVQNFKGSDIVVYAIPEGTQLPKDLVLVEEKNQHFSLQAAKKMTLDDLNEKITKFLEMGTKYTRDEWLTTFRNAEVAQSSSAAEQSSFTQTQESGSGWIWSKEHQRHYRYDDNGGVVWDLS